MTIRRGDLYVAYSGNRPAERLFVSVTRVARDGTWVDLFIRTWAVGWAKRVRYPFPEFPRFVARAWDQRDLDEQETDHMAMLREKVAS